MESIPYDNNVIFMFGNKSSFNDDILKIMY